MLKSQTAKFSSLAFSRLICQKLHKICFILRKNISFTSTKLDFNCRLQNNYPWKIEQKITVCNFLFFVLIFHGQKRMKLFRKLVIKLRVIVSIIDSVLSYFSTLTFEHGTNFAPNRYASGSVKLAQCQLHIEHWQTAKKQHDQIGYEKCSCENKRQYAIAREEISRQTSYWNTDLSFSCRKLVSARSCPMFCFIF